MAEKDMEAGMDIPRRGSRRASVVKPIEEDPNTVNMNDEVFRRLSVAVPDLADLTNDARDATDHETQMGFMEAIRLYPKAVGWSVLLSTAIVMEGYDVILLGSFYAFPKFQEKYGVRLSDGSYQIPAPWQTGLSNGANVGEILGLFLNGIISEKYGYRKTMIGALSLVICFIFINFFAPDVNTLLAGEILCGIPWGVFQTLTTTYASEVCPVALRAYLTTYVNLCWVMGQLIASGVLRSMLSRDDEWAYRIPFALQWMWPVPLIVGILFAPESPWWLVRCEKHEEAKAALKRLTSPKDETFNPDQTIAMMVHTNEIEKEISAGTSYLDCFKGVDLRRTEVTCMIWLIQVTCGSSLMGYSTYFYEQAGLSIDRSFDLTMAGFAIGFCGTVGSWFLMGWAGRRTLYLYGLWIMFVLLLIIGFMSLKVNTATQWAIGSMLLVYTFTYDITVGPVCYSLVTEIPSSRLRTKTVVLSRNLYNVGGIVTNFLTPYMLNPTEWNWKAKAGFFWAGSCLISIVWTYFRLPEPKGRTYGELDILFERRVSARKFKTTKVDVFRGDTLEVVAEEINDDKAGTAHHE